MAFIPLHKGFLPTSTPIHHKDDIYSEGFQRIFISSSAKDIELSPIKELLPSKQISSHLSNLYNENLAAIDNALQSKSESSAIRASKKLKFVDCADVFKKIKSDSYSNFENDSGFNSVDICPELENFPDLNCLKSADFNCSFQYGKISYKECDEDSVYKDEISINNEYTQPNDAVGKCNFFKFPDPTNALVSAVRFHSGKTANNVPVSKNVDLISSLYQMNCSSILSHLLSYLSNEDLRNANNVNKTWRTVITEDMQARERRIKYLKEKKEIVNGPDKENRFCSKIVQAKDHKQAFSNVTNLPNRYSKQPLNKLYSLPNSESWAEETKNLKNCGLVLKCPKCHSPSEIHSRNQYCCTRELCKYVFCKKCRGPYLNNHVCSLVNLDNDLPKIIIGSKRSKKNLKRL